MDNHMIYETIKSLADNGGNKARVALQLGCSKRTINRHIAGYKDEGKAYFIHGNQGRHPSHTMAESRKADIRDLYLNKYNDTNFAHFTELLTVNENIYVSESSVRNILAEADILSPKAGRRKRREYKKRLEVALKETKSAKATKLLQKKLIEASDPHPRRSRCANFGEMIQMDASLHLWSGDHKWTLHIAIDDATGKVVGAWFDEWETLRGYHNVFRQILCSYGIPYMFYTDRRTVFEYRKSGGGEVAKDTFTQFSYACKQFGVQIETTSVAQAKGRVERLIQTMQSRLPAELRLEGATTIEQANEFLPGFIARYNARFALPSDNIPSVFEEQPSAEKIDMTLSVITKRTVDSGHCIRFDNRYFRTLNGRGLAVNLVKKTDGLVIRTFSGNLFFSVDSDIFALEEIPLHERASGNFDVIPPAQAVKQKTIYIPPANHPWRIASFASFVKKQSSGCA